MPDQGQQGQWRVKVAAGEFGPIGLELLGAWVQQGRVTQQDFVFNPETGAWVRAGDLPQLAGLFVPLTQMPSRYQGVKGWLLLFCISLTIFNPLATAISLSTGYNDIQPHIARFPGLWTVLVVDACLSVALMAFSIYAGAVLWGVRPNAVRTAKRWLLWLLGYMVVSAILPFTAGLPPEANEAMIPGTAVGSVRILIYFAIWYSYLNKSKRVKATYAAQAATS